MQMIRPGKGELQRSARDLMAGLLCLQLAGIPMLAAPMVAETPPPPASRAQHGEMGGEQRVLHALNRLTFGPRPGEVATVERIGLKRWFEQQLNPGTIDDSALDIRLAAFPAMALSQQELMYRYPDPQRLKAMIQRNEPLPRDPVEHAIYADSIAFYKEAQARKAAGEKTLADASQAAGMTGTGAEMERPNPLALDGAAQERRRRGVRVDLLGGEASPYTMPGKKKTAAPPVMDAQSGAATQAQSGAATQAQSGAATQEGVAQPAGNRGRARHDEAAFPESATAEILALPPDARVRRILALEPEQLVNLRRSLSQPELAAVARDLSPQQKEIFAALGGSERMIGAELLESRLERDVYSQRQIEAVMTDFWLNHFNVYLRKNGKEPYLLPAYERETIRPHALGRFEDLLIATARSPAMLMYLDNWQSIGPESAAAQRGARFAGFAKNPQVKQALKDRGLNENYARELMELHTVGVGCEVSKDHTANQLDAACGKGYTQADVTEVAKVFSGWTIDRPADGAGYHFEERRHEPGKKTVLGQVIHENGEKEGLEVLHMLAMSPATARFLSTKLAVRLVSDTPPPAMVDRMAKSYLASGGEIKAVLRTMFDSPEFWSSEVYRAKVKTPLEFVASALRATDADVTNAVPVVQSLDRLGMPLYGMQTPNGYSWKAEPWVSTGALVSRMNFALVLSGGKLPGTRADWTPLLGEPQTGAHPVALGNGGPSWTAAAQELRLENILLGAPASDRTRQAVLAQAQDSSVPQQAERDFLARGPQGAMVPQGAIVQDTGGVAEVPAQRDVPSAMDRQAATMAGLLLGSPEFQRR